MLHPDGQVQILGARRAFISDKNLHVPQPQGSKQRLPIGWILAESATSTRKALWAADWGGAEALPLPLCVQSIVVFTDSDVEPSLQTESSDRLWPSPAPRRAELG